MSSKSIPDIDKPRFEPDEQRAFYEELGRALSTWAGIEDALSDIYGISVCMDNPIPAMNAYWAVISFEGKKAITDAALVVHIKDEVDLTEEWTILAKTLRNKQGARNNLAHGTIVTQRWNTKRGPKSDTFLAPRYHSQKLERKINKQNKVDPRPKSRYPLKNIISERNDFHKLMIDLWEFSDRLHQRIQSKRDHAQDITIRPRVGRYVLPPDNQKPRKK